MIVNAQYQKGLSPEGGALELIAAADAIITHLVGAQLASSQHHTRRVLVAALRAADYGELDVFTTELREGKIHNG